MKTVFLLKKKQIKEIKEIQKEREQMCLTLKESSERKRNTVILLSKCAIDHLHNNIWLRSFLEECTNEKEEREQENKREREKKKKKNKHWYHNV